MSEPQSLWDGFGVLVVGILFSLCLIATLGQIGDKAITILTDIGMFEYPEWSESTSSVYTFQSFLFFSCSLPAITGLVIFVLSAVRRQRYDVARESQIGYLR